MSYTKDEVIAKIIAVLKDFDGKRNPSVIMQKLGWNKDTVNDMCSLFNVSKFSEILSQIPQIQIEKNKHGAEYRTHTIKCQTGGTTNARNNKTSR